MAKIDALTPVSNLATNSAVSSINDTLNKIEEAFENTLSRDGSSPNQMEADIDLNSNDLLNAKNIIAERVVVDGKELTPLSAVDTTNFATAAQGVKADTALQPDDIGSSVAAYNDARIVKAAQLPTVAAGDADASMVVNSTGTAIIAAQRRAQRVSLLDSRWCSAAMAADMLSWSPTLDHTSVFTAAIAYCQSTHSTLYIPAVYARLTSQITMLSGFSVECDDHAVLRWVNSTGTWGWKCVGDTSTGFPGYGHVHLPFLYGPNTYTYTGVAANNVYDLTTFFGDGLTIDGWVFGDFRVHRAEGWGRAIQVQGTNRTTGNIHINAGVIDLCYKGLSLAPNGVNSVYQSTFDGDNIFAYYPIYISTTTAPVFEWIINVIGLTNSQSGGVCIYFNDVTMTGVQTCTDIQFNGKVVCAYSPTDSPSSPSNASPTSTSFIGTIIGGNQIGPNSEAGYANGGRNYFELQYDDRVPSTTKAFKLKGQGSRIKCKAPIVAPVNADTSITLSQTAGLANFNGGKPCIHKLVRVLCQSPTDMAAGGVADFYYYNELVNTTNNIGVNISSILNTNGIEVSAIPNGTSEHGKVTIRLRNSTSSTILAANTATNFWIEIPYA